MIGGPEGSGGAGDTKEIALIIEYDPILVASLRPVFDDSDAMKPE
jgi:hypothetical protein